MLALLVATTAAFTLTEALKLQLSPVTAPHFDKLFSPTCRCETGKARLSLRLREPATVDVVIVDAGGEPVRTLAVDVKRPKGVVAFRWDGRDDAGDVVSDGRYRLRIHLDEQRRTIVVPDPIRVDTRPPEVDLVSFPQRAFSPDGDGRNDKLRLRYRTTERSRPLLVVDGSVVLEGRMRPAGKAKLVWGGRFRGGLARPAAHTLWLRVRDRAGNLSDGAGPMRARVRYVELTRPALRARRAGVLRFRVVADARIFRWKLVRRSGRPVVARREVGRKVVAVRLPVRIAPGAYRLRVVVNGHEARGRVVVRARTG